MLTDAYFIKCLLHRMTMIFMVLTTIIAYVIHVFYGLNTERILYNIPLFFFFLEEYIRN